MAKQRYKFRLKPGVGSHFEPNPDFNPEEPEGPDNIRDYEHKPGATVVSARPLDKLFVNKFEVVGPATPGPSAGGEDEYDDERPVRSEEQARVNATDRHAEEDELDDPKLKKLARGEKSKKVVKAEEEEGEEDADDEEEEGSEQEDVTDQFNGAKDGGLQVFKDSDGVYRVHEEGEDEPMDGSKKGFTTKKKTAQFIAKNVKTEEDEE